MLKLLLEKIFIQIRRRRCRHFDDTSKSWAREILVFVMMLTGRLSR